jgi:hypothetical protein
MPTNFRVGDHVEDKKTHKRGRVTFVYSELELKGEVIKVLFDGRDEPVDVLVDSVRSLNEAIMSAGRVTCRTRRWVKSKNSAAPAVKREVEEDWAR